MGLAPAVASLLHILLELDPPVDRLGVMVAVSVVIGTEVTVTNDGGTVRVVLNGAGQWRCDDGG